MADSWKLEKLLNVSIESMQQKSRKIKNKVDEMITKGKRHERQTERCRKSREKERERERERERGSQRERERE